MKFALLITLIPLLSFSQNYTSYFTGNAVDLATQPYGGICLMGGATEDDNAMTWFLEQANGGDILVLRASGSDGYNIYLYTDLGVSVNSVETIVFNDATAADETYIHQKINQAEAIWFAGGDQWDYISYWRNTPIDSLINSAISSKKIVIGGTSAGMAIMGDVYFTAENGTISSASALNNPYATASTIDSAAFLNIPYMQNVITDTHYDNPDRRGRHTVFMSKIFQDYGMNARGIACEEYVAVCIDTLGIAHVYGGYPTYDEQAYFIQINCEYSDTPCPPENCTASNPLTWSCNQKSIMAYKINGTSTGANYFDLNTWENGSGGEWQFWFVENGTLGTSIFSTPNCNLATDEIPKESFGITLYPNPTTLSFVISSDFIIEEIVVSDLVGRNILTKKIQSHESVIQTNEVAPGSYILNYSIDGAWHSMHFCVE